MNRTTKLELHRWDAYRTEDSTPSNENGFTAAPPSSAEVKTLSQASDSLKEW